MQPPTQPNRPDRSGASLDDPPPVLGSWKQLYSIVLGLLAFWIVVFFLFTLRYGPAS